MSEPAEKLPQSKIDRLTLETRVGDLATTAILAASGVITEVGEFNGYLNITCRLGDFHVHIHACATPVDPNATAPQPVRH